jgi:glycosyltransferase involved in cell wall biosynthesis
MKNHPPQISVIIPVYNSADTIGAAVASILAQTYADYEILVIDDCSTDSTPAVVDELAAKHPQIRAHHNPKNLDISGNRNLGISLARGDFVAFVDADDTVEPRYLETLHSDAVKHQADISVVAYREVYPNYSLDVVGNKSTSVFTSVQALDDYLDFGRNLGTFIWGKLFRRRLFAEVKFPDRHIFEDIAVLARLYLHARTIVYNPAVLYKYAQNPSSQIHSHRKSSDIKFFLSLPTQFLEDFPDTNPDRLLYFKFMTNLKAMNVMLSSGSYYPEIAKQIRSFMRGNRRGISRLPQMTKDDHLKLTLLSLGVTTYRAAHRLSATRRNMI